MVKDTKPLLEQFETDPLVIKIVNLLMKNGKKIKAEKILRKIFFTIQYNYPGQVLHILYLAIFNAERLVGARIKPKGKKFRRTIHTKDRMVPYLITRERSQIMGIRSIFLEGRNSRNLSNKPISFVLSQELVLSANFKSGALENMIKSYSIYKNNKRSYRSRWKRKLPLDLERMLNNKP